MCSEKDCIFCKIIKKEIPAKIVLENDGAISFLDINPISDGHTVVIPKKHCSDLALCDKKSLNDVISLAQDVAKLYEDSKLKPWGFNYLSNQGSIAGQEVMHFHLHVIPKYAAGEGFKFGKEDRIYTDDVAIVYDIIQKQIVKNNKKAKK